MTTYLGYAQAEWDKITEDIEYYISDICPKDYILALYPFISNNNQKPNILCLLLKDPSRLLDPSYQTDYSSAPIFISEAKPINKISFLLRTDIYDWVSWILLGTDYTNDLTMNTFGTIHNIPTNTDPLFISPDITHIISMIGEYTGSIEEAKEIGYETKLYLQRLI